MRTRRITRRWLLLGAVGVLAGWSPVPVEVYVVNASGEAVHVRMTGTETWIEAKAAATVHVGGFGYDGLCSPPDRWLSERFEGLEEKLADGSVVQVSRETFAAEAEYDRGWSYRFRGGGT